MKKRYGIAAAAVILLLGIAFGLWRYAHPTHYLYNDRFVLGSTEKEIVERYGTFDRRGETADGELLRGVYMIRDNTPELIMSYDDSLWYEILFENGIAVEVTLQEGVPGG